MKTFQKQKFYSLLPPGIFSILAESILPLSSAFLAGNLIDENALCAVGTITPLILLICAISVVIGDGTSLNINKALGSFQKEEADRFFGQGILLALLSGVLLCILTFFGGSLYLDFYGISEDVKQRAMEYLRFFPIAFLLQPLFTTLDIAIYSMGDGKASMINNTIYVLFNTIGAFFFCKAFGMAGLGLAYIVGLILPTLFTAFRFKRFSVLHPALFFSFSGLYRVLIYSLPGAVDRVCLSVTTLILNKIVIGTLGERRLLILSIVCSIIDLSMFFDGVGSAYAPLICIYYGEKNNGSIQSIMTTALKTAVVFGAIMTALLLLFANQIPSFFHLTDPEMRNSCAIAIRILAPSLFFLSVNYSIFSYYTLIDHVLLSVLLLSLNDFFYIITLVLCLTRLFGSSGIWISYLLSPILVLLTSIFINLVYCKHRKGYQFPWMLKQEAQSASVFHVALAQTSDGIALRDDVNAFLLSCSAPFGHIQKAMLIAEEFSLYLMEKNPGKPVLSEWFFTIKNDTIHISVLDDGNEMDLSKENTLLTSFQEYFLYSFLSDFSLVEHLRALNANYHCFEIK